MPRPRTVGVAVAVVLLLVVSALLVALPAVVRRVAVDRLTEMTGRTVTLRAVGLNVFTGRVALERFRVAQRGSNEPALELESVEVRVSVPSLVTNHVRVKSLTVTTPRLYVARLSETAFDFSDLLALVPPPDPDAKPSSRTISIDRLALSAGALVARDHVTQTTWKLEDLTIDGASLSTREGPPGRLSMKARLNGTAIAMDASAVDLGRGVVAARVAVEGFEIAQVRPFVPASLSLAPVGGRATIALDVKAETATPSPRVSVTGDARLDDVAVLMAGASDPFVTVGRIAVKIKDAQPLAGAVTLDTVTIEGADVKVRRDAQGRIDVLALTRPSPGPAAAERPASTVEPAKAEPAARTLSVRVHELALRGATVMLNDETVKTTLKLSDLTATVKDVAWPGNTPLAFDVATGLPGAGRLLVKGTATLQPVSAAFTMSMRGAPITPYQPYIPIPGRVVGTFNGESRSRVTMAGGALVMAVSQGKSWIEGLELRDPAGTTAPVRIAQVSLDGIDFTYPGRAAARTITVTRPQLRLERDEQGNINVRKLFAAQTPPITTTRTPAPVTPAAPPPRDEAPTFAFESPIPLEIGAIVIENGDARFVDRTTKPAFSETLTHLAVRVDGLSSQPGRRAKLAIQAVVGADAAVDLKGEIAPFGELYAHVQGEMRKFVLPTVNPYADTAIAWIIEQGTLTARLDYKVERNQITARNEIVVENLHVARSRAGDEVQRRIGLPLGMIVALVTDSNNSIRVNLPIEGTLQDWAADLRDAIWTVVKNAVVNIVAAPFKGIGRLFTGKDDTIESLAVDPARFPAGSATVAADAEAHLTKVADFLRRAPAVKLRLAPVTTPADLESLRTQGLAARLQQVQREQKLKDLDAAIAAEFARVFPGEAPPRTAEAMLARLREREDVAPDALGALATQRLEAVRETLAAKEGIQPARLVAGAPGTAPSGDGRVEFTITR